MNTIKKILIITCFINLIFPSGILNENKENKINFSLDNPSRIEAHLQVGKIEYLIINNKISPKSFK